MWDCELPICVWMQLIIVSKFSVCEETQQNERETNDLLSQRELIDWSFSSENLEVEACKDGPEGMNWGDEEGGWDD